MANDVVVPTVVEVQSPNVTVEAPVSIGGFLDGIVDRMNDLVEGVKGGDVAVMTSLFLGISFIVAGVFIWRRV
jgi:hypothetical protein